MWISLGGTYSHGYCTLHHSLWPYMQLPNPESIWACDWAAYFSHSLFNFVVFSHSVVSTSLQTHGLQHTRLPCPSACLRVCLNSTIESVMPSNHLILCHPLLLLPSLFPSIRTISMSQLFISRSQNIGASASAWVLLVNNQSGFPLGLAGLIYLLSKGLSRVFSSTTVWKHQFFSAQPSLWSNSHIHTWLLETS